MTVTVRRPDGRYEQVFVNDAALAINGYERDEFLRMNPLDVLAPGEAERVTAPDVMPRSGGATRMDATIRRKDGRTVPLQLAVARVPWPDAEGGEALVSYFFEVDESAPVRRSVHVEDGATFDNMCLSALAYSEGSNLLAYAGVGNEIWVSNPLTETGRMVRIRNASRVHSMQFDDLSDSMTVLSDVGVELLEFALDSQHLPVFEQRTVRFTPLMKMVGCYHYCDFLFIASMLVV